jgi:hypothetical protein
VLNRAKGPAGLMREGQKHKNIHSEGAGRCGTLLNNGVREIEYAKVRYLDS